MKIFEANSKIIITCSNRIAPYLQKEVESLGYVPVRVFKTGVELKGTMQDCIKLNLNLRCASQVLFSIHQFRAFNADALYKELVGFEWADVIDADGYFSITSNVDNETINNSLFANVKVKDAIVDYFRNKTGKRPNSGSELDKAVVHLYWKDDQAEIFIDTSGETLSKHGYRKIPGKAPMLEALAAATLLATKWDKQSAFVNPMCGSSTIAIEAALLATNRMPGLYRSNYAFMHLAGFQKIMYDQERTQLYEKIVDIPGLQIIATDISTDAINISKINAGAAGVAELITFAEGDFETTTIPPDQPGVIYFNPEYGDRLGEETALQVTYKRMGDFMKKQWLRLEERYRHKILNNDALAEGYNFNYRLRYNLWYEIPFVKNGTDAKSWSFLINDEVHINFGKQIVNNYFDQNRFFVGFKYQVNQQSNFQFGYMYLFQQLAAGNRYRALHVPRLSYFQNFDLRKKKP